MTNNNLTSLQFLRLPQVLDLIPISKSSWYAGIKNKKYPAPLKLSERTSVWRSADIIALIESVTN